MNEMVNHIAYMLQAECKDLTKTHAQLLAREIYALARQEEPDAPEVIDYLRKQGERMRKDGSFSRCAEISTMLGDVPCWVKVEIEADQ